MSYRVMRLIWPIPMSATEKVVAVRLADFASDDGGSVFPSISRVANDCNLSRRAVQLAFRVFEREMGILLKVREASTGARRPAEYRFDLDRLAALNNPDGRTPCTSAPHALANGERWTSAPDAQGLVHAMRGTSAPHAPRESIESPVGEASEKPNSPAPRARPGADLSGDDLDAFDSFWGSCPRKEAKGHARKAFKAALAKTSAGDLVQGIRRYADRVQAERTEPRYIKLPATWLNAEAWLDEPTTTPPSEASGLSRTHQRRGNVAAVLNLVDEEEPF